jgi:hypothetical protein
MKKYFAHLRPLERRLAVGVAGGLDPGAELGVHLAALFRLGPFAQTG